MNIPLLYLFDPPKIEIRQNDNEKFKNSRSSIVYKKITNFLENNPDDWFSVNEISENVNYNAKVTANCLREMKLECRKFMAKKGNRRYPINQYKLKRG